MFPETPSILTSRRKRLSSSAGHPFSLSWIDPTTSNNFKVHCRGTSQVASATRLLGRLIFLRRSTVCRTQKHADFPCFLLFLGANRKTDSFISISLHFPWPTEIVDHSRQSILTNVFDEKVVCSEPEANPDRYILSFFSEYGETQIQ
jgi:hypothetical protein